MSALRITKPSRRRRAALCVLGLAVAGAAIVVGTSSLPESGVGINRDGSGRKSVPDFEGPALVGGDTVIRLADFRGQPVVLNFWATWCTPCRRELPILARAHAEAAGVVAFVGINHQDDREAALDLVAETGIGYPSIYDPQGQIAGDYGLLGMPTTVFIDADGLEVGRHTGELSETDLRDAIDELARSPGGGAPAAASER